MNRDNTVAQPFDFQTYYHGRTILLTGGAGCIGSNLTRALAEVGAERIIILDDLSSAYSWNVPTLPGVEFVEGDILDEALVNRLMDHGVSVVYHLAALFANQNSIDHPRRDLEVNGLGTLKLLELARDRRIEKFIFASSGCSVYGSKAPLPLTEDYVSLHLDTPYQITKLLGELYCNFFFNYYHVPVVRARFFNVYGPGEVPGKYRNVIPNFIYRAMRHEPLTITGTGEETRDFTYVTDIVDGLLRLGAHPAAVGEAVNLASERETTVTWLADYINEKIGNAAGVVHTERRDWDQIIRRRASVEKGRTLVGYDPDTPMSEGLDATIAWVRENWERVEAGARFAGERAATTAS